MFLQEKGVFEKRCSKRCHIKRKEQQQQPEKAMFQVPNGTFEGFWSRKSEHSFLTVAAVVILIQD